MQASHISTRDPTTRLELAIADHTTAVWSSHTRWRGVVVELHRFRNLDSPPFYVREHTVVVHRPPAMAVELKIAGKYQRKAVQPDDVSLFSAGAARQVRHGPAEFLVIALAPEFVAQTRYGDANAHELGEQHAVRDPRIVQIASALEAEANAGYPTGRIYGEALGVALAAHLVCRHSTRRTKADDHTGGMAPCALRRVVGYIDDHLTEEMRLGALARVAGLSPHRFAHNFKRETGLPPYQFVIRRRVERAKPMLRDTDMTVATVTYASGFNSPSRFTSLFRRETGLTPSRYRALFR